MTDAPGGVHEALSPSAILQSATASVSARAGTIWFDHRPEAAEDVQQCLAELGPKVQEILDGADPAPTRAWVASDPLIRALTQVLARELVRAPVADEREAMAMLAVLRALSEARGDPLMDVEEANLEAAMGGADAFELLVEVAHDFRSPLTSILFLAEALRDGHSGPVNDVQRSQLGLVYGAALELASIASDVVDLARRRRGLTDDEVEDFSLPELFATVERTVRPIVEERGLELKISVPHRGQARGHVHALGRVLLNLTTNALKFTDTGSVELAVRTVPHDRLEFRVRDTGRGIPPERREELFKPFQSVDGGSRVARRFSGSGVGLSIARRLLRCMGSELHLDFSDDSGTQFSFVLPASPRES